MGMVGWREWYFACSMRRMKKLTRNGCRKFSFPKSIQNRTWHAITCRVWDFANILMQHSKIFPPTADELPPEEQAPEDTATTEPAPAVSTDATTTKAPTEKLKSDAEDIEKDWEPVEKPSETASEKTTDISEEGEKVEAPDLGGSDGEKIEKPETKDVLDEAAATGKVLPQSSLEKDW